MGSNSEPRPSGRECHIGRRINSRRGTPLATLAALTSAFGAADLKSEGGGSRARSGGDYHPTTDVVVTTDGTAVVAECAAQEPASEVERAAAHNLTIIAFQGIPLIICSIRIGLVL
jgi:hypothetical protein